MTDVAGRYLGYLDRAVRNKPNMSSGFRLLGVESRDFSHAEKERTACKASKFTK